MFPGVLNIYFKEKIAIDLHIITDRISDVIGKTDISGNEIKSLLDLSDLPIDAVSGRTLIMHRSPGLSRSR